MEFATFAAFMLSGIGFVNAVYAGFENNPEDRKVYLFLAYFASLIGLILTVGENSFVNSLALGFNCGILIFVSLTLFHFRQFDFISMYKRHNEDLPFNP